MSHRSGNVLVVTMLAMIGMLGVLALAIDVGYLKVVGAELQRSADSAAIAAATRLIEERQLAGQPTPTLEATRSTAGQFVGLNRVACQTPGLAVEDVTIGELAYPFSPTSQITNMNSPASNAVCVRIRLNAQQNQPVGLFFAKALGFANQEVEGEATAAFIASFKGFKPTETQPNVMVLPFALDKETWDGLMAGGGSDSYKYDPLTRSVSGGGDQIREVNLYPQGTGAPGNRGTVDIGNHNNATPDIRRQILEGISPEDLAYHGGKLELGPDGTLSLNGDTGLSAGFETQLQQIIGETRIIPIFSQVTGPGNNAWYTIVQFAGVRVMGVKLTGQPCGKHVTVQPAHLKMPGAIYSSSPTSTYVFSPVCLVK